MLGECQVNVKSQSELDIGGRETCLIKNYIDQSIIHKVSGVMGRGIIYSVSQDDPIFLGG